MTPEPEGAPLAATGSPPAEAATEPHAGLWLRYRWLKQLHDPERMVEVDVVTASKSNWAAFEGRNEPGWEPVEDGGIVLAARLVY